MTLETLIRTAALKIGGYKALMVKLPISRQRLNSAINGGPSIHIERLVRLAAIAEVDPLHALRVGGREEFAKHLAKALKHGPLSADELNIIRMFRLLAPEDQQALVRWMDAMVHARTNPHNPNAVTEPSELA